MNTPTSHKKNRVTLLSRTHKAVCLILLCVCHVFLARPAVAATVTYVGSELGSAGTGFAVQNWSNAGVSKLYDIGGTEKYGSAGYYQIRPVSPFDAGGGVSVSEVAISGNNLGTSSGSYPTLFSTPSFLSSITGGAGNFVNFDGYGIYRAPDGSALVRQGALSVPVNQGPFDSPAGANASYVGVPLEFTLNSLANFRLGLAVDSVASGLYSPNYVSLFSSSSGTVFSTALVRDGTADMVFFDVTGAVGDRFTVGLWQNTGTQSVATLSLVTFDVVPEPSAGLLVLTGCAALVAFHRSRKHRASAA
jgi:hypothetical protein